jgi:hypothetical protein
MRRLGVPAMRLSRGDVGRARLLLASLPGSQHNYDPPSCHRPYAG